MDENANRQRNERPPEKPVMEITKLNDLGEVVRLSAKGQIVESTPPFSDPVGEVLGPAGYDRKVLLNMAEVRFFDSMGLGWLLKCNKRFREAGGTLVIHSIPPVALDMMKVMGLSQVLKLSDDEASALATIQGIHP
jgi:anti-anti-sigma factor